MRLYMKQKMISITQGFNIMDENGSPVFKVKGELLTIGRKLHLLDLEGNELAFIRQKLLTILPKMYIYQNGQEIAIVKRELTLLRPRFVIEGLDWVIQGDYLAHDYSILVGNHPICRIHKVWLALGDCFEIDVDESVDLIPVIAVILAIDYCTDSQGG